MSIFLAMLFSYDAASPQVVPEAMESTEHRQNLYKHESKYVSPILFPPVFLSRVTKHTQYTKLEQNLLRSQFKPCIPGAEKDQ